MMKFTIRILLVLLLISCSDFLEVEHTQQITVEDLMQNREGVLEALNGSYTLLSSYYSTERPYLYPEIQSGNVKFTPTPTGSNAGIIRIPEILENVYNFNDKAQESDFQSVYENYYKVINSVNQILAFIGKTQGLSDKERQQIESECYAIRAFSHFMLLRIYSQNYTFSANADHLGIVYQKTPLIPGEDFPARKTVKESTDLILEDIEEALALYQEAPILANQAFYFFNKQAVLALGADVALWKNDWNLAYTYSNDIITTSNISLTTTENYIEEWYSTDDSISSSPISESILNFNYRIDDGEDANSVARYLAYTSESSYSDYALSEEVYDLFQGPDIRRNLVEPQTLNVLENGVMSPKTYYFTKKYKIEKPVVVYRLSEMYLIRAEASFQLGNLNQALEDINTIKLRANSPLLNTTSNFEEEIFEERRRELAFESKSFYDVSRMHRPVERIDGCISNRCNLDYPNPKYILPIPFKSLEVNQNIIQNESY